MDLNIISFNLLSRQFSPLQMLLKNLNLPKDQIKKIIKGEIKRFNQFIGPELIKYFKYLITNTIIFLQEANDDFLRMLKDTFNANQIFYTLERDYTIQHNGKRSHKNFNDDHRVILVPEQFTLFQNKIINKDIQIISQYASKSGLMLSVKTNDVNLVLINLHLHWRLTYDELSHVAEKINGELKKTFIETEKLRIIICGDFNKGIKKVENFFINPINQFGYNFTNGYKTNETQITSHNTDVNESKQFDTIDHILTHGVETIGSTQVKTQIANSDILIDVNQLINLDNGEKFTNISDHNLIKLRIML
jgi:endonuclease/exonuclease/phosphatase family metal-dependent hydrolase